MEDQGATSTMGEGSTNNIQWKKIWSLALPGKVKHFIWRLANNSLPLRMKLKRKGIELDTRCPVCYRLDEDGGHCFFKCKMVKALWRAAEMEDDIVELMNCPNAKWVFIQILQKTEEKCLKICTLLWSWWLQRNKANKGQNIKGIDEAYHSFQLNLTESLGKMEKTKEKKQKKSQVWSPPPDGFLKINSDGSFKEQNHNGGWGFIIRNDQGENLVAGAGNIRNVFDPLHAEAVAMKHAIEEAVRMGCLNVILETDATVLRQAMITEDYDEASIGALVKEMKSLALYSFQCCKIEVCPRSCNNLAHCLAALGANQEAGSYQVWFAPFPRHVNNLLADVCSARLG